MPTVRRILFVLAVGMAVAGLLLAAAPTTGRAASLELHAFTPTAYVYLPIVSKPSCGCSTGSTNSYSRGTAFQFDMDNPVRPAYNHADKNIELRGYTLKTGSGFKHELVNYGSDDPHGPPQFATMFRPYRVPNLDNFYQVGGWLWSSSPNPGTRGDPISSPPVTALGLRTTPGEPLYVPASGYDIGGGMEVTVLFADEDTISLRYAREDSAGSAGYTVHVDNICTDPNLLALYNSLDNPAGPRYVYRPPAQRPYAYDLPTLSASQSIGRASCNEIVVVIVDTGGIMDPRSCNDWWQVRPGYTGACPSP